MDGEDALTLKWNYRGSLTKTLTKRTHFRENVKILKSHFETVMFLVG